MDSSGDGGNTVRYTVCDHCVSCGQGCDTFQLSSCEDKETVVCALYCDNRLCCGANGTIFDPPPTHTGGWGGGIFSHDIKRLDTLLPLGFKHGSKKSKTWFCSCIFPSESSADPPLKSPLCWSLCSA